MKILLVEDDDFKSNSLSDFINELLKIKVLDIAPSVVEAIKHITHQEYDLILVDMAIPSHPITPGGGAPMSFLTGGLEILLELKSLGRRDPCIIVTQYPEIELSGQLYPLSKAKNMIKETLDCDVLACIAYSEDTGEWKNELEAALEEL